MSDVSAAGERERLTQEALAWRRWATGEDKDPPHNLLAFTTDVLGLLRRVAALEEALRAYDFVDRDGHRPGTGRYSLREVELICLSLGASQAAIDAVLAGVPATDTAKGCAARRVHPLSSDYYCPCSRETGHAGAHRTVDGIEWTDSSAYSLPRVPTTDTEETLDSAVDNAPDGRSVNSGVTQREECSWCGSADPSSSGCTEEGCGWGAA